MSNVTWNSIRTKKKKSNCIYLWKGVFSIIWGRQDWTKEFNMNLITMIHTPTLGLGLGFEISSMNHAVQGEQGKGGRGSAQASAFMVFVMWGNERYSRWRNAPWRCCHPPINRTKKKKIDFLFYLHKILQKSCTSPAGGIAVLLRSLVTDHVIFCQFNSFKNSISHFQ